MKNDQWFEPGDKVMRVASAPIIMPETDFGIVLCVDRCEYISSRSYSRVFFVGIPSPTGYGHLANNFRKVEEIQLCVRAAKKKPDCVEVES